VKLRDSYLCPTCDNVSGGPGLCIMCGSGLIPLTTWIKPLARRNLADRLPSAYCQNCMRKLECIDGTPMGDCPKGLRAHIKKGER
jgi:hypothetical protein